MMTTPASPLVDAASLRSQLAAAPASVRLLDISFDLADTALGERQYRDGHLPGALYLHLDRDLSAAKTGRNGRHPLPARADFARRIGQLGIAPSTPVVVYDAQDAMYAVRAWWMLRWLGHARVWVLDGGRAAWVAAGGALEAGDAATPRDVGPYPLAARAGTMPTIDADTLQRRLGTLHLLDARAGERFRGEIEPIDTQAGHIPGALNRPFKDNLAADGRFKPAAALRVEFAALLGDARGDAVVHQCGSGVTSCHNLLAMEQAGLGTTVLYPGSWSEWSSDPARPVATG